MLPRSALSLLVLLAALAPSAQAAEITALPAVERTVAAKGTASKSCAATARAGRGVGATTYVAPMSGYVNYRLRGRGDWDLQVLDERRRSFGASQGFGGQEIVQNWVMAGQRVTVLACRMNKRAGGRAALSMELLDVAPPAGGAVRTSLVRVFAGQDKIEKLEEAGLDVTHNRTADYADVMVAGDEQRTLLAGLRTETRIEDFDANVRNTSLEDAKALQSNRRAPTPSGRKTYRSYADIQAELKALVSSNPGKVKPVVIGKSYQGRELNGVEIADDVNGADGRPVFLLVALHHAREWPSAEAAMEYATMLARGGDPRVDKITKGTRTVIVPLINPDGYVSSRSAAPYDPADNLRDAAGGEDPTLGFGPLAQAVVPPGGVFTYRRKNCAGLIPNPSVPCELQVGVDPNRNYGEAWGGPGSSANPTAQSYHGPGPWSEPETQAVHAYSQLRSPTNIISLHNVAALVLRPPGVQTNGKAPDEARLKFFGDQMAAATGYTSQYGFQLYDTTGTTEDWNYAAQGAYGYTIEIGPRDGEFHMPYETGVIKEWEGYGKGKGRGLRDALLVGAEAAASSQDHSILAGKAPAGRTLRIKKSFVTKTSEHCVIGLDAQPLDVPAAEICPAGKKPPIEIKDGFETTTTVPASGRFEWHVNPSKRPFAKTDESYTFTCEDNGKVLYTEEVFVARGKTKQFNAICGASPDAAGGGKSATPAPGATPPAAKAPAGKKAKKKLTAAQRRVLKSCLAKANRTAKARKWSKRKRASARKACERKAARYKAKKRKTKKR